MKSFKDAFMTDLVFIVAGTSAGVGFAIPSSTVVKIVPQLIQFGKVCLFCNYAIQILKSPLT